MPDHSIVKKLRIREIISETVSAKTFVLDPEWEAEYKAGQFLTLVFDTPFGEKRRSYSISSSPDLQEHLSITVKRLANGEFSRPLLDYAKPGDILYTQGISGFFCMPDDSNWVEQVFFLAAGSGITPCFSIIKSLLHTTSKNIVLVYSNRSVPDAIFYSQLQKLQRQYAHRFDILFLFSNNQQLESSRLNKWLLEKILIEHMQQEKEKSLFFLCGPFEYMQMATIVLLTHGIPAANIKKEVFEFLPRAIKPVPPDTRAHEVTIHIGNRKHVVTVQYPNTILSAAKARSIELPYSCESGRCGSCVATCTSGKTWMAYNEVLVDEELAKGRVLVCQAYPVFGDVGIDFNV